MWTDAVKARLIILNSRDGFFLNVGYPKLDWVPQTLRHLYGYAEDLVSNGGKFKLALSLDLYATGTWCYDKKLGNDCGGVSIRFLYFGLVWNSLCNPAERVRDEPEEFPGS